jgi:signal transduction histidine kinase
MGQPRSRFFIPKLSRRQFRHLKQVLHSGKPVPFEGPADFPVGLRWLNTWLVPLRDRDGKLTSTFGISRDITDRKQMEIALIEARDELEVRIEERTAELMTSQDQLRQLAKQIITIQEDERRRVSRELHDEAGQMLVSIKYGLASVLGDISKDLPELTERLDGIMTEIDRTIQKVRDLAHDLRPPALEIGGIHIGLKDLCTSVTRESCLKIVYEGETLATLPDEISISLYRIAQEALANILKHAHATRVRMQLQHKDGVISLTVSDNGQGISAVSRAGTGLLGIDERLKLLNGTLAISTRKDHGTKLIAQIPWTEAVLA